MTYDAGRKVSVLFVAGQTWEWDGASWSQVNEVGPSARWQPRMVYETARASVLLFGGDLSPATHVPLADTWVYEVR
jgi:hypothetical protein